MIMNGQHGPGDEDDLDHDDDESKGKEFERDIDDLYNPKK